MEPYANLGGDSGVVAYEIGSDSITVQFSDGGVYLYNYQRTGRGNVEHMKQIAVAGIGLSSFINAHVRKAYARKIR
jgi:hypothetical protein